MGDQLVFGALAWNQPYNTSLKPPFSLFLVQGDDGKALVLKRIHTHLLDKSGSVRGAHYQSWVVVVGATNRTGFEVRVAE